MLPDLVRLILLILLIGAFFLYGFFVMKRLDHFLDEVKKAKNPKNRRIG